MELARFTKQGAWVCDRWGCRCLVSQLTSGQEFPEFLAGHLWLGVRVVAQAKILNGAPLPVSASLTYLP